MIDSQRLLQRFLRYVQIDTTAVDQADVYPSSPGQRELGALLVDELHKMGLASAHQDEHGVVLATIPANGPTDVPAIAFNAHLDTSPETTGKNVRPQIIDDYQGGDIVLPAEPSQVIRVQENSDLKTVLGHTLITTDGTTLLGGDDKAGIAVIMELAHHLSESADVPHGDIRVLFTCDEEIGRGVDYVDLEKVDAIACYTLDGPGANQIDVETFSADMAIVRVKGVNLHPSIGKGRLVNAVRAAGVFLSKMPHDQWSPETTEKRAGFLHPYHVAGGVAEVEIRIALRDFETTRLATQASLLQDIAKQTKAIFPQIDVEIEVTPQYRNLRDGLQKEPRAVAYAEAAHRALERVPQLSIIRGGTDGSQLTTRGLPTPNLSTGQHNPHSPLEWASLDEMRAATELLIELSATWARQPK